MIFFGTFLGFFLANQEVIWKADFCPSSSCKRSRSVAFCRMAVSVCFCGPLGYGIDSEVTFLM